MEVIHVSWMRPLQTGNSSSRSAVITVAARPAAIHRLTTMTTTASVQRSGNGDRTSTGSPSTRQRSKTGFTSVDPLATLVHWTLSKALTEEPVARHWASFNVSGPRSAPPTSAHRGGSRVRPRHLQGEDARNEAQREDPGVQ